MGIHERELLQEEAIRMEYSKDYFYMCRIIGLTTDEAIEFGRYEELVRVIDQSDQKDTLDSIQSESIEMQKLYVAAFMDHIIKVAIKKGLPSEVGESKKREVFHRIIHGKNAMELKEITLDSARAMLRYREHLDTSGYSYLISHAIGEINNYRYKKISTTSLADMLHCHPNYLSHQFKKEVGVSLIYYIQRTKIDAAAYYLEKDAYEPTVIADMMGFSDYSYFAKVFRRHKGMSPLEYRKISSSDTPSVKHRTLF